MEDLNVLKSHLEDETLRSHFNELSKSFDFNDMIEMKTLTQLILWEKDSFTLVNLWNLKEICGRKDAPDVAHLSEIIILIFNATHHLNYMNFLPILLNYMNNIVLPKILPAIGYISKETDDIEMRIHSWISWILCCNKSSFFNALSGFCKNFFLEDLSCWNQNGINLTTIAELPLECVCVINSLIPGFRELIL